MQGCRLTGSETENDDCNEVLHKTVRRVHSHWLGMTSGYKITPIAPSSIQSHLMQSTKIHGIEVAASRILAEQLRIPSS
jgi:pyrrolidone-carboxylate peptidase